MNPMSYMITKDKGSTDCTEVKKQSLYCNLGNKIIIIFGNYIVMNSELKEARYARN